MTSHRHRQVARRLHALTRVKQGMASGRVPEHFMSVIAKQGQNFVCLAVVDKASELDSIQCRVLGDFGAESIMVQLAPMAISCNVRPPYCRANELAALRLIQGSVNRRKSRGIGKAEVETIAVGFHHAPGNQAFG